MSIYSPDMLSDEALHIDAMWEDAADKILRADDITTPTGNEPFFDAQAIGTPSPVRINYPAGMGQPSWALANQVPHSHVEPSNEPCTEEIPWSDLVFWLGNATGQVECSCSTCVFQRSHGRIPLVGPEHHAHAQMYIPSSVYRRLSAKIPVIAMPRIEGVN